MSKVSKKYIKQITIGFLAGLISRIFFHRRGAYISPRFHILIKYEFTKSQRNISVLHIDNGVNQ